MMGVGMDKRDIDLMNDEAFWRMNEETLNRMQTATRPGLEQAGSLDAW